MTTVTRPRARRGVGLNATYLRIETLRALANPWTIGFSAFMPALLYLLFGASPATASQPLAHGNVAGLVLLNMALFGAMSAGTNVAGSVSDERGSGWNRQLRLTPLRPSAYVAAKLVVSLVLGAVVVAVTLAIGALTGARLDPAAWVLGFGVTWLAGTGLFSAFGLAVGYLFKGEAVLGVAGPLLSLFAFFGGLFIPLEQLGEFMQRIAVVTPMWGLREIVAVLVAGGEIGPGAIVNVLAWFAIFAGVAVWRFGTAAGRE